MVGLMLNFSATGPTEHKSNHVFCTLIVPLRTIGAGDGLVRSLMSFAGGKDDEFVRDCVLGEGPRKKGVKQQLLVTVEIDDPADTYLRIGAASLRTALGLCALLLLHSSFSFPHGQVLLSPLFADEKRVKSLCRITVIEAEEAGRVGWEAETGTWKLEKR